MAVALMGSSSIKGILLSPCIEYKSGKAEMLGSYHNMRLQIRDTRKKLRNMDEEEQKLSEHKKFLEVLQRLENEIDKGWKAYFRLGRNSTGSDEEVVEVVERQLTKMRSIMHDDHNIRQIRKVMDSTISLMNENIDVDLTKALKVVLTKAIGYYGKLLDEFVIRHKDVNAMADVLKEEPKLLMIINRT